MILWFLAFALVVAGAVIGVLLHAIRNMLVESDRDDDSGSGPY
jgi:hypothetical protein